MAEINKHIESLINSKTLSEESVDRIMQIILMGGASTIQIAAISLIFQYKDITHTELYSIVKAIKKKLHVIEGHDDVMNISIGSFSEIKYEIISILVICIIASFEYKTCKSINKISKSPTDLIQISKNLGYNIEHQPDLILKALEEADISISFSQNHTKTLQDIIQVGRDLGFYSIFDTINSLITPVNSSYHLVGMANKNFMKTTIETLSMMDCFSALVFHNQELGDVISINSPTAFLSLNDNKISSFILDPKNLDFSHEDLEYSLNTIYIEKNDILEFYTSQIYQFLNFKKTHIDFSQTVFLNASAALVARGLAKDFPEGIKLAQENVRNGKSMECLKKYVEISNLLSS
jgi:anthranilate phosphoribosyltransferase